MVASDAVLDYVSRKRKEKELRSKLDRLEKRKAKTMQPLSAEYKEGGVACAEGCACEKCSMKMADGGFVDPSIEQSMIDYPSYLQPDPEEVARLEEEKKQQQMYGGIGSGLSQIAAAVAGGDTKPTAMQSFQGAGQEQEKQIQELKGEPAARLQKLLMLRKLREESKKAKGAFDFDPESDRSKAAAERIGGVIGKDLSGLSEAQIAKIAPGIMATGRQQISEKGKEKRSLRNYSEKKKQKFQDDVKDAVKMVRGTKPWQQADEAIAEMPTLRVLLEDAKNKGGQSLAMLGPKIARSIANEVGVLTEQDVTRYVQNPELVGKIIDIKDKWIEGKLSEASYDNLKRLLDIIEKEAQRKRKGALAKEAKLFARREGLQMEEVLPYFDVEASKVPTQTVIVTRLSDGKSKRMSVEAAEKYKNNKKFKVE